MRYPWLFVGAKIVVARRNPGVWVTTAGGRAVAGPQDGDVVVVTEVQPGYLVDLVIGIDGWPSHLYDVLDFRPVLPNTDHIIEQLKASLPKRGRVDA